MCRERTPRGATQNPVRLKPHVGSTPTSGTNSAGEGWVQDMIKPLLRSSFGLLLLWLALGLVFLVVRPRPFTPVFWSMAGAVLLVALVQMRRARKEAAAEQAAFAEWERRLSALGAVRDVDDDGHLYEWLDPPHW